MQFDTNENKAMKDKHIAQMGCYYCVPFDMSLALNYLFFFGFAEVQVI